MDLLDIVWSEEWDVVFLLDVLEHTPDRGEVLRQIRKSMRPGGLLFVTTPALTCFWTYNNELAHHQRRYCAQDFEDLATYVDLDLLRANYFMFFLSPALLLSRILFHPPGIGDGRARSRTCGAYTSNSSDTAKNNSLESVFD